MFIQENYLFMKGWWKKVTMVIHASLNLTFTLSAFTNAKSND